ncbi:unnamed protein product [Paramecium sonneborni]|uniref:Uncharacterized protein n=1 Tax=Paramecium sonneborni TaxID=65129 RepID=A0A8S1RGH4_9CILI|nr:unnamed protein product [Paramecium sonneborni]
MDCFNLVLLEKLFYKYTKNGCIDDLNQWHGFLEFLYVNQLFDPNDMLKIKDSVIYFPLVFENLKKILANANILPALQEMSRELDKLYNQVNDCRTTLKNWNYQTFSVEDMKYTTKTYEEIEREFQDFKNEFDDFAADVIIVNQPIQSLKSVVKSFPIIESNPLEYLSVNRDKIDREYAKIRVKSVQYRNQAIKILKQGQIKVQVGYDHMNDSPVEVWLIPKCMWRQQEQCELLNTFEAHHELILSQFFPKYLGQDLLSDDHNFQHFMELKRGHTLKYLLKQSKKQLTPDFLFFRTTMRQVFGGLYDILRMTRFYPVLPITLSNIQVGNDGVQIYLRNVRFSELREDDQNLEATLLENFAQIIMSTLGMKRADVGKLGKYLDWKNLLQGLFNAEEDHQLYKKGVIQQRLTFCQLLNHDLFDDDLLSNFEVSEVVQSYHDWIS